MRNWIFLAMKSNKTKIVLFFLSIMYSFGQIFWGFDFTDTFFYINLFPNYQSNPMASGTLILGLGWTKIFGASLVSIRVLAWCCGIIAVLLPFSTLIPRSRWISKIHFLALSVVFIGSFIYGADVTTLLVGSISVVLLVKYIQTRKLKYLLFLAVSSSFAVFLRFPNILFLFIVLCSIPIIEVYYNKKGKKKYFIELIKLLSFFLVVYLSVFSLAALAFHDGVKSYFNLLHIALTQNTSESHSFFKMIMRIVADFNIIIQYMGVLLLITIVYKKTTIKHQLKHLALVGISLFFIVFMATEVMNSSYNWNLMLLLSAIVIYVIIYYANKFIDLKDYKIMMIYIVILLFSITISMGSNTGLLKLAPLLLCFLPFLINENDFNKKTLRCFLPLVFILIVFVLHSYSHKYEDQRMDRLTSSSNKLSELKYVHTTEARVLLLEDVLLDYSKIENKQNVVFYGGKSHIFYYLTHLTPLYKQTFWMLTNDTTEVINLQNQITKTKPIIFFTTVYPEDCITEKDTSDVEKMIFINGYECIHKKGYKIYHP